MSFLINWAIARKHNWHIALRIEDLDTPRVKPGVIKSTIQTLSWIGIDWDSGPTTQADQIQRYQQAMEKLASQELTYPCSLSRSQIESAASAPHSGDPGFHEIIFDISLRPDRIPCLFSDVDTNWRFLVSPEPVEFCDTLYGPQSFSLLDTVGDFVVWTKRGTPSYQLAVVVDDALSGVNQIIRGSDLLDSAARQILLYNALKLGPIPNYTHLPLVKGEDGRRLAKRHGDTRIDTYTQRGTTPEQIIGLIAFWCKITKERAPMSIQEFKERFSLDTLGTDDITFTSEDDQWLLS